MTELKKKIKKKISTFKVRWSSFRLRLLKIRLGLGRIIWNIKRKIRARILARIQKIKTALKNFRLSVKKNLKNYYFLKKIRNYYVPYWWSEAKLISWQLSIVTKLILFLLLIGYVLAFLIGVTFLTLQWILDFF